MPFAGEAVIAEARLRHPTFDPVSIPQHVALSLLNGIAGRLHGELLEVDPSLLVAQTTTMLPLATFEQGIALPPMALLLEAFAITTDVGGVIGRSDPVTIINYQQRYESGVWPALYCVSDTVFLKGIAAEWAGYDRVSVVYVPVYAPVNTVREFFPLPDRCLLSCIEGLAALLGMRVSDRLSPTVLGMLRETAATQQSLLMANVGSQRRTEIWSPKEY